MKKVVIGVSGDIGSFSEKAAVDYATALSLDYSLRYLIDMDQVLSALNNGDIEFGIFPVHNNLGGMVTQAIQAMGKYPFTYITHFPMTIEQCLMTRSPIHLDHVTAVVSHPQGLAQCAQFIHHSLPNADAMPAEDTAIAARYLAAGKYSDTTAVIAPEASAHQYGLLLLAKGVQDTNPNITTFIVVSRRAP